MEKEEKERAALEVPVQVQSDKKIIPLSQNCEWINRLAESTATCLTTRGIPSKE
ncbi:hypothetical protein B0H39_003228 [Clostridium beijerinckii]|uniref:hypothetical protein n=1 Tax=Clostridium beijerinckii TaxID=1520 RepID=UPI00149484E7|nr:hypothetical protein [Clostridium beijerinckii]NOW85347.1 hypothetical protein [Clostridium beijerinckii]